MRQKRTYKKCAKLLPYQRQCQNCPHRNCTLRNKVNWNEEAAQEDLQQDQKSLAEEMICDEIA